MGYQVCAIGKAIRPLFADPVTFVEMGCMDILLHFLGIIEIKSNETRGLSTAALC